MTKEKKLQISETEKECQNMIKSGMTKVSMPEYEKMLAEFGLKLALKHPYYTLKYYNTFNEQHYLCCTTEAVDNGYAPYYNTFGTFYNNEVIPNTQKYLDFKKFKNKYFTQLQSGHILSI